MTVLHLPSADQRLNRLWQRYLDARLVAERSGAIRDGIAAGRAWAEWLRAFEGGEARVIPLRGRR